MATPATPVPMEPVTGSLLFERMLLGWLTALIVAREFISSNDPGRLRLTTGAGHLTLNLLTFVLLFAWTIWRGWSRRPLTAGRAWIVGAALLVVGGLAFASAGDGNRYARPGWFMAWDWMACACICFLVWQLASTDTIARGLVAVLLATAVCAVAQALYQEGVRQFEWRSAEATATPPSVITLAGDDEFGLTLNQPITATNTFRATFDRPDTFAAFLVLLIPVATIWGLRGWRSRGWSRAAVFVPILLTVGLAWAIYSWVTALPPSFNGWTSATRMIGNHPALGVGPGNFSRYSGTAIAPGGFWLGLAATNGLIASVLVLAVVVLGLVFAVRNAKSAEAVDRLEANQIGTRWELYQGGVFGLLLGMILATGDIPAEADASEMLRLGVVAVVRGVLWFAAFGLLQNVAVRDRFAVRCLVPGIVVAAALGIVSDGLSSPGLLFPLFVALTLTLTAHTPGAAVRSPSRLGAWISAAVAMTLIVTNLAHVYVPGVVTASSVRAARAASKEFPHAHWKTEARSELDHIDRVHKADDYVTTNILRPLRHAFENDPDNSALMLELARWNRWHWHYYQELRYAENARKIGQETLKLLERADQVDSRNLAAKLGRFETLLMFASPPFTATTPQLAALEKLIGQIAEVDPIREVPLRHRVVLTLLENKPPKQDVIDTWAVVLLKLDSEEGARHGKLTPDQRSRLIGRLKQLIQRPSQELAEIIIEG